MLAGYLLLGVFAGFFSGLIGIGGGVIIVPALAAIFAHQNSIPQTYLMHMAIGTSLAIVIVTTSAALLTHSKNKRVRWDLIKIILPGLIAGTLLGTIISSHISSHYLRIIFCLFLFLIGWSLLKKDKKPITAAPRMYWLYVFSIVVGLLSSMLGVGGGLFLIPLLLYYRVDIRNIAGTTAACVLAIGLAATASYAFASGQTASISGATGYIYWPAFAGVALTSILFAPLGAYLSYRLPGGFLKKLFGVFLWATALYMLFLGK